jgi:hypothetical protein
MAHDGLPLLPMMVCPYCAPWVEQLQLFGKSTWHPSNFDKTIKIGLQHFGKPT